MSPVSLTASVKQISSSEHSMIPELFTTMLSECHHYTPEPRSQTRSGET